MHRTEFYPFVTTKLILIDYAQTIEQLREQLADREAQIIELRSALHRAKEAGVIDPETKRDIERVLEGKIKNSVSCTDSASVRTRTDAAACHPPKTLTASKLRT
ncbi:MAG TPA: hypothetical protein VGD78_22260 [Chthoniobacterales bacterium]